MGGVDLDNRLKLRVVIFQIGVPAPHMRNQQHIVAALQCGMQFCDRADISVGIAHIVQQGMAGPANFTGVAQEVDIAISANRRDARPFITQKRDESSRVVELLHQALQFGPELVGDLEIVRLMADKVHRRVVAGVQDVIAGRDRPHRLPALPVKVSPVKIPMLRLVGATDRIGIAACGRSLAGGREYQIAGLPRNQLVDLDDPAVGRLERGRFRKTIHP